MKTRTSRVQFRFYNRISERNVLDQQSHGPLKVSFSSLVVNFIKGLSIVTLCTVTSHRRRNVSEI